MVNHKADYLDAELKELAKCDHAVNTFHELHSQLRALRAENERLQTTLVIISATACDCQQYDPCCGGEALRAVAAAALAAKPTDLD